MPKPYCDLHFKHTISRWDEAIPLGNGSLGALVWGPASSLRLSLDRADLWDTTPFPGISEPEFTYATMVRMARAGQEAEIRRIFDAPYNHPTPCKLPAGALILHLPSDRAVESRLSLTTATAALKTGDIKLEIFLHAEENVGICRVNLPHLEFQIENPQYGTAENRDAPPGSLKSLSYPAAEYGAGDGAMWFIQRTAGDTAYGVFASACSASDSTLLTFTVGSTRDGADWRERALDRLRFTLARSYSRTHGSHKQWWKRFWSRSSLTLPDKNLERNWYLTNYFLASCSRKGGFPMALQGVWTADDGNLPPWKGDYHHDLNTQLSYSHYCKANHMEEGESFVDYLWAMADCGRRFAKDFYGTDGLCMPAVMSIDGQPLGGWGMYALSPTNQIWLCQIMERHARYTADKTFWKERALPYLTETATCIAALLEERDGQLYLPISSSPEVHDDHIEAFLTPNSNYDLALMRWLFGRLSDESPRWRDIYEKLPQLALTETGVLKLSPDETLEESHRHHSNLMAICPLGLIDDQMEAGRRIVEANLLDLERRGPGLWCGYSYAWAAELYAMAHNGNAALRALQIFWKDFCSPNGFHLNGDYRHYGSSMIHYRPFTLEGNMEAAHALQEMLLQCKDGNIEAFPALPEEWRDQKVSFTNFRAEGGKLVTATYDKGIVTMTVEEMDELGQI